MRLREFGPVTFPAYAEATASARAAVAARLTLSAAAGRIEDVPTGRGRESFGRGPMPLTLRRLRTQARLSRRARELLRALERGDVVAITWARGELGSARILERKRTSATYRLMRAAKCRRSWAL